jgi:hypothetical protein
MVGLALYRPAWAAELDGVTPLSGVTLKIVELNPHKIIDDVNPDTIGFPRHFLIDFKTKMLRPAPDSLVRKTIQFDTVTHIEQKIVMQGLYEGVEGVEDGLAWSLSISKKSGKAVLTASGSGLAYVVFGRCQPVLNPE